MTFRRSQLDILMQVGSAATQEARAEHAATHHLLRPSPLSSQHVDTDAHGAAAQLGAMPDAAAPAGTWPPEAPAYDLVGAPWQATAHKQEHAASASEHGFDTAATADPAQPSHGGVSAQQPAQHPSPLIDLQVGVLHFSPTLVPFPLLARGHSYVADTFDMADPEEREFWMSLLMKNVPSVIEKARPAHLKPVPQAFQAIFITQSGRECCFCAKPATSIQCACDKMTRLLQCLD